MKIIKNGYLECDNGFISSGLNFGVKIRIPVFCYLVKHPKGTVLIDTGFSKHFEKTWGKRLKWFEPILERDVVEALKNEKITHIINTHLHIDHAENNFCFPGAEIIVQKEEYEDAKNPPVYDVLGYEDSLNEELKYRIIEGKLDLFGDGSIIIIPTPGHTKGHQSVFVKEADKTYYIAGDACYSSFNLQKNILPGIYWNAEEVIKQYDFIRSLSDTIILYGHDESNRDHFPPSERL